MQARKRVGWGMLACGLTLLMGLAMAEVVEPPAPVVKTGALDAQAVNTAPSFVAKGKVTTDFGASDFGRSVAFQSDGKIVVAGNRFNGTLSDFALARYLSDGSLDNSFGIGGKVTTDFSGDDWGYSVALQSDGKIVAAGSSYNNGNYNFALARYLSNGSLDNSFGVGGKLAESIGLYVHGHDFAFQADGKIVVAGVHYGASANFALARYLSDGSLDNSFGIGGKVTTDFSGDDWGYSVALQSDGKIVAAGSSYNNGNNYNFALARYLSNGSLDNSFGVGGKVTTDFGSSDYGYGVVIQQDGTILVAGASASDFALARYLSDGSLDNSFGIGGKVITLFGPGAIGSTLAVQADNKIVVAGSSTASVNSADFALARYLQDGNIDTRFGHGLNTHAFQPTAVEQYPALLGPYSESYDAELAALGTYDRATLTIIRQGGANPEDVFSASGTLTVLTPGSYFAIDGVTIGQVLANSAGTLQLRFLGANATQARVDKAMQQIAYMNTSDRPPAQVLIDWTFDDGNTGAQGTGGALSTTGTVTVNITPVNDYPRWENPLTQQAAAVGQAFSYTVPANTFSDPDGDTLSYSLTMADNTGIPPWLTFNPATRTLSGTPSAGDVGTLNLRVTAKDPSNLSAQDALVLQVGNGRILRVEKTGETYMSPWSISS